jgi:uncharacterized protein (TIGR02246 family)
MRRSILAVSVLSFLLLAPACAPADTPGDAPPAAVDIAADEQAIRDLSARWVEMERARDAAGIAALFSDDGMLYRDAVDPITGRAAIEAHLASEYSADPNAAPDWSVDRIIVSSSGDLAVEYGTWSVTGMGPDGTGQDRGRYVATLRKTDGTWHYVSDMSMSTMPDDAAPTTGG